MTACASCRRPGASGRSGAVDPAVLFLVKNLDLLCEDGVLAIVLPDGIARATGQTIAQLFCLYLLVFRGRRDDWRGNRQHRSL